MYQEKLEAVTGENGALRGVNHEILTDNLSQRQLADMLRKMPREHRLNFTKNCRLVAVLPVYLPEGDFTPDKTAINLNSDELNWFLKRRKSFVIED